MRYPAPKLKKRFCEICFNNKRSVLQIHHIIPRRDPRCTDNLGNLAVLCSNCHNQIHSGDITIIGVYSTTDGRKVMWFNRGEEPPLSQEFWLIKHNPLVIIHDFSNEDD